MHRFSVMIAFVWLAGSTVAMATDWTGQTATPLLTGPVGSYPFPSPADGSQLVTTPTIVVCNGTAAPPPCPAGQHLVYGLAGSAFASPVSSLPASAGAPGSNVGVAIYGGYYDPASPTGISNLNGTIPLSAFASSSSLAGLNTQQQIFTTQINQMFQRLQDIQQQLIQQDTTARQGTAVAMAMSGTGDIGPDEKVALSMNYGYFGGQSGVAGAVAVRAAEHLTFNGGIAAGMRGGPVGARAGVRIAW